MTEREKRKEQWSSIFHQSRAWTNSLQYDCSQEDPAHNVFSDVTDAYRDLKCEIVKGYYRDGWMEQEAKINVMTGANGQIDLEFMYPGVLDGKQNITISVDGKEPETFDMENNIENKSYKVNPYSIVTLQFDNDFVYPDAKQQRGELPLSVIMNVTTSQGFTYTNEGESDRLSDGKKDILHHLPDFWIFICDGLHSCSDSGCHLYRLCASIHSYLPNVWSFEPYTHADVLTRMPINYIERMINVGIFGYSTTF